MAKRKAYPYDIMYPLPHFKRGGYLDTYLQQMYGGGDVPSMTALNTSASYMPKAAASMIGVDNPNVKNKYDHSYNASGLASGAASSALSGLDAYMKTGQAGTAVKSLADSAMAYADPTGITGAINQAGNILGDWAKSDYQSTDQFGNFSDPGKTTTATEIGFFINPLDRVASGLNGEGWTGSEVTAKRGEKTAPAMRKYLEQQRVNYKNREIESGNAGNYFDQNSMMSAAYGGSLPVTQNSFEMQMGGPISKRYGMSRADLPQLSNYNSGIDIFEDGGELQPQQQQEGKTPQITQFNTGGQHSENTSGFGGVPVDSKGNQVIVSGNRPVASVEQNEVAWFNPKTKTSYIFSDKLTKA